MSTQQVRYGEPRTHTPRPRAAGRVAARLRRALWWTLLTLTGGVSRRGRLPRGGCVVVANHTSHADTAALLAALDAAHSPTIAAAADYWFASRRRSRVCSRLAAGFPVRRTGGGTDDLLAKADALRAGRAVVLFPEGTRARAGDIGTFHKGALVLARRADVPVVPVGIAGTDRLLPKHGRLRPALVRVTVGEPLPPTVTPAEARAAVVELHRRTAGEPLRDSRARAGTATRDWLTESALSRGSRTLTVGLMFGASGFLAHRLRRFYGTYLVLLGSGFTAGLAVVVANWR
ncbi:lysophospholipid acyltransferase family protein [Streptomyces aureocirculatus]|uniref:lysophospholipid acyltransferase family protein n=1 Tax=Streptomyces aureocirculatus TaxID=67275 RepID=UPI0004C7942B|nr:lysophospholipid acyltransferase family protein [Streptomyces aureocirculatus]